MAEALVAAALVRTVIGNVNSAALQGVELLWGVEDELKRLESVFSTIQLVLQDAEVKQRNNEVLQNWLRKLKDAAYDAEDVLDLIATEGLRRRFNSERGKLGHLTSFFSKINPSFRLKIAKKVKDIMGRLDAIADERRNFHLRERIMSREFGDLESRQTSSLVNELEIFGRNEDRETIVEKLLCNMADQDDISVYAIWGMGGIGKTTLAQLVYNDESVKKHFELRIWVCVSDDFSLQRLVRAILESVQEVGSSVTELDPLLRRLQEKLRGKKFLLVLDDIWNVKQSLWDPLKESLRCGSKDSGVMVTTRIEKTALMMATITPHRIGYLSEADSWSLFKRRAFAYRTEEENLVRIGEAIVKKCGGVPLAIKTLGSLMQSKSHESEWLAIKDHIFPILSLSYDNLPPRMRVGDVESRQTSSLVNESEIFGRNEERDFIVEKLLSDMADQDDLSVCAIWGMGGIGKTTLAQLVYNDDRVGMHFDLRIWVCVSDDFSLQRLVRAILEDVQGSGCSLTELYPMLRLLQEILRGKRFLLVLDDVWNDNQSLWDPLKEALRCGWKGSRVMVTTRIEKIALMMATIMPIRIGYLSHTDSWSLFKRIALAGRMDEENLVEMGEAIVKKCGGVPLAIKALGSLMRFKSHESQWLAIKESEIWNLPDHEDHIFPILRLSYNNLSPRMRQCFAYCCIFPKDYWMDRDHLIQLWMANGFLHVEDQTDLYLIGQSIFEEFVCRSFLQDVQKHDTGKMRCKMHHLMHDLAESVMRHESCRFPRDNVQEIHSGVRYLSCHTTPFTNEKIDKLKLPGDTLRSLVIGSQIRLKFRESFSSSLSNQKHLRVLDSSFLATEKFLNSVHKWGHLRFLTMSCDGVKSLSNSITRLHNLQTLRLRDTYILRKLPKGLKYMKNLWFVEIESHRSLICTPPGLGELTSLQRLSIFIVGEDPAHQIGQLKELNLGGKLSIRGLENVRNLEDIKGANMITKQNLTSLRLSWTSGTDKISMEHFEATLEDLQPHHNLEEIHISSYQGSRFPNWMSASAFTNLSKITLGSSQRCEHLPALGKLPALKELYLIGFDSIRRLCDEWCGDGKSSFVALTELYLWKMPNLEEWIIPNSHESFLSLQSLRMWRCPKLTRLPFLRALKYLDFDQCEELERPPEGLDGLNSLEELRFRSCENLRSFPAAILEKMPSLRSLSFQHCEKLDPLSGPLQRVTNLHELTIFRCPELKFLRESIQQLSALRKLGIWECYGLSYLPEWIGNLQSLSTFDLYGCRNLTSLPDGFRNLKSLSQLDIRDCSRDLLKRCEKSKGEDWPQISHIPQIRM